MTDGRGELRFPPESSIQALPEGWSDFTGILFRDDKYYLMSLAKNGSTRAMLLAPLAMAWLAIKQVVESTSALRAGHP